MGRRWGHVVSADEHELMRKVTEAAARNIHDRAVKRECSLRELCEQRDRPREREVEQCITDALFDQGVEVMEPRPADHPPGWEHLGARRSDSRPSDGLRGRLAVQVAHGRQQCSELQSEESDGRPLEVAPIS